MNETENLKNLTVAEAAKKFGWTKLPVISMVELGECVRKDLPARAKRPEPTDENSLEQEDRSQICDENHKKYELYAYNNQKESLAFAKNITLRDVLSGMDLIFKSEGGSRYVLRTKWRGVMSRIAKIGFTRLDSVTMPALTISVKKLSGLPRKNLLDLDALILGTFSQAELRKQTVVWENPKTGERKRSYEIHLAGKSLWHYDWIKKEYFPRLTVANILAMERNGFYGKGATKTLELLERLGFGPKDGPFMRKENDSRGKLVGSLVAEDGLTRSDAVRFANIAAKRNWI